MEMDTWYGAPFSKKISSIPDGTSKLSPPADLKEEMISFLFSDAYSPDTQWKTKGRLKSFQAEEFKTETVTLDFDSSVYFPVRYIHAEYDLSRGVSRHFDGALHLYTEQEYFSRRDLDFNHDFKIETQVKPRSEKIFKMNGSVDVDTWVDYCCHFCSGNPLIVEYFTGVYPDRLQEILRRIRSIQQGIIG